MEINKDKIKHSPNIHLSKKPKILSICKSFKTIEINKDSSIDLKEVQQSTEDYFKNLSNIMLNYKYHCKIASTSNPNLNLNSNEKNDKTIPHVVDSDNDKSLIRINVNFEDFHNPFQSLETIETNKNIFNEIIQKSNSRQYYKKEDLEKIFKTYSCQIPNKKRIKITNSVPKQIIDLNSIQNDLPQINNINIKYNNDNLSIDLYGYYLYPLKNFPEGREQFSLVTDGVDILLYGGIVSNKNNSVWKFDTNLIEWTKINNDNPSGLRYGHSGVMFQKKLFVFGGKTTILNYFFHQDLEIFNIEESKWYTPILHTKSFLKLRRNHVAKIIGNNMIIHGGISEDGQYLGDLHILNFHPLKWTNASLNTDFTGPVLAWHSCELVLPRDIKYNPKTNVYKIPEINVGKRSFSRIKEKGFYFFGGKSEETGNLKNDIWILRIGKKPLEWYKPQCNGNPPSPRYSQSMNFYEEGNFLVIHGGRNDISSDSFALNDTFLLDLTKFDWIQVNIVFDKKSINVYNRCGHGAIINCIYYLY